MLEKPNLPDEDILASLRGLYNLNPHSLTFLPIGADVDTAVYQVLDTSGAEYFVKLRRGGVNLASFYVPNLLGEAGTQHVIKPIPARTGALWSQLHDFALVVYPFIHGEDGFTVRLGLQNWNELGKCLHAIHDLQLPEDIRSTVPQRTYDADLTGRIQNHLDLADSQVFQDDSAIRLVAELRQQKRTIEELIEATNHLSTNLDGSCYESVLCHGDIHAGNVLICDGSEFYVVDWDTLTLAPKEQDLMFIGAGIGNVWNRQDEVDAFFEGYGKVEVDQQLIAYFRCERVLIDIDEFCSFVLLSEVGGSDRAQAVRYFVGQFEPGDAVDIALRAWRQVGYRR